MEITKMGVVGAGMMGAGIAQSALEAGLKVKIYDRNFNISKESYAQIKRSIQRKINYKDNQLLIREFDNRFEVITSLKDFSTSEFIVEAIVEDMQVKKELFAELDKICQPNTILASNTSALSITEMSEVVERKDRFAGFHFHLPVNNKHIVDVIPTIFSSDETIQVLIALGKKLGKEVVLAKDLPGFIVNRLLFPFILDAIRMYEQGIADRDEIDISMQLATSHPMGPLMLADFIGLDTILSVSKTLYEGIGEKHMQAPKILQNMVKAGLYGIKSGQGFYDYSEPKNEGDRRAKLMIEISKLLNE